MSFSRSKTVCMHNKEFVPTTFPWVPETPLKFQLVGLQPKQRPILVWHTMTLNRRLT